MYAQCFETGEMGTFSFISLLGWLYQSKLNIFMPTDTKAFNPAVLAVSNKFKRDGCQFIWTYSILDKAFVSVGIQILAPELLCLDLIQFTNLYVFYCC